MYQRVVLGPNTNPANQHLTDLSAREIALLVPVVLFIVWIGVYPGPFLDISAAAVHSLVGEAHALVKPGGAF
jgi:NADH-quinone oxidoreductase subunit M